MRMPTTPSPRLPATPGGGLTPQHEPFYGPGPGGPSPGVGRSPGPHPHPIPTPPHSGQGPSPHPPPPPGVPASYQGPMPPSGVPPGGPGPGGPMHGGPMPPHMMPPFMRRHTPFFNQPEFRIHELNRRLQQRCEESDNLWWDAFATEFFEDDATLTVSLCLEDGPKRYTIGRTLIPRYFRSMFEGGVTELFFHLKHSKESFHNTTLNLDCDHATMYSHHGKPVFTTVATEGRLTLDFTYDDMMRIKGWHFQIRNHREFIPRSLVAMNAGSQDPGVIEQLSKNITRVGLTNTTLNYLRLCVILEPMQELMCRHKTFSLSPRDCLKTTLFQKWQRMVAPPGEQSAQKQTTRQTKPRRKRKCSTATGGGGKKKQAAANNPPPFPLPSQVGDVMVVGEPTLMGGEFGEEDERLITRLENTNFEATNGLGSPASFGDNPMGRPGGVGSPWPPSGPHLPPHSMGGPMGPRGPPPNP
ncbi:unnamed protein product, partial [Cyprideis torosa]